MLINFLVSRTFTYSIVYDLKIWAVFKERVQYLNN